MTSLVELAYETASEPISKGLPSALRGKSAYGVKNLQLGERMQAHQIGRAASQHYATGSSHGWQVAENGRGMRAQSRTGWSGQRGFGKPQQPAASTPASRLRKIKTENQRSMDLGRPDWVKPTSRKS